MKKCFMMGLVLALLLTALSGCGAAKEEMKTNDRDSLKIVTTVFPVYDWTKNLLGDQASAHTLQLLLKDGVDMHSFQPSVSDLATVSSCDLLIYIGGESEEWIEDALQERQNPDMRVLRLLDVLGERALQEELAEGMEGEAEDETDEHVWLSIQNAELLCEAIRDALKELDGAHARSYDAACAAYCVKLQELDAAYRKCVDNAKHHCLIFADRFPFRYLVEDYGLEYYAAFAGCSAETEASFNTVIFLANKLDELGLGSVCVIENSDGKLAHTVVENAGNQDVAIVTLHSMQSMVGEESYLSLSEKNLEALREALN